MDGLAGKKSDDNESNFTQSYTEQEKVKSHDHPNIEEKWHVNEYGDDDDDDY